jgi:type II secretory pathway pseudopilin PulG
MYIEVLASVALLGISLLAIVPLFYLAARENAAAGDLTFSTTVAYDMAETLKQEEYYALVSGQDVAMVNAMSFDRSWVVDEDVPYPGMKTVTITVVPSRIKNYGANRVASVQFYRVPD